MKEMKISKVAQEKIDTRAYKKSRDGLINRNKQQTILAGQRAQEIRTEAKKEFARLSKDSLFLSGVSLYWAEGYKKGAEGSKWKSVDFANSDPKMICVMMRFFRESCNIPDEKFRAQLIAHENIKIDSTVKYWAGLTGISKDRFIKTSLPSGKVGKNRRKTRNLTHGTLHIRINDVKFFYRIIGWIDGLKDFLGP